MENATTWVGLDVHKVWIVVAVLKMGAEAFLEERIRNTPGDVRRWVRRLREQVGGPIAATYEAGPCGYELKRLLEKLGVRCIVAAPALVPVRPGDRIKTDRRDARRLARALRSGDLTEVHAPTPEQESARDLVRARGAVRDDLQRLRHRLSKLLLRRGVIYRGKSWTARHRAWLFDLRFEDAPLQAVLEDLLVGCTQAETRLASLSAKIEELAATDTYRERVGWIRCLHGFDTLSAMVLLTEIHDISRFRTARQLMSYLGVVPSEHSSGERKRRGGITHSGNRFARWILVEGSWHARLPLKQSPTLTRRRAGQPAAVVEVAQRTRERLHKRYHRMVLGQRKPPQVAIIAIARELIGAIWAILTYGTKWAVDAAQSSATPATSLHAATTAPTAA